MPSKKKKYNARFPAGRIKKIMQSDEEIGKVAQAVPVIISRTLELFVESLLTKTLRITNARNAKTLSTSHMKQCIMAEQRFDFLKELVKNIPDISATETEEVACNYNYTDDANSSPEEAYPDSDTPFDLSLASTSLRELPNGNTLFSRSISLNFNGGKKQHHEYIHSHPNTSTSSSVMQTTSSLVQKNQQQVEPHLPTKLARSESTPTYLPNDMFSSCNAQDSKQLKATDTPSAIPAAIYKYELTEPIVKIDYSNMQLADSKPDFTISAPVINIDLTNIVSGGTVASQPTTVCYESYSAKKIEVMDEPDNTKTKEKRISEISSAPIIPKAVGTTAPLNDSFFELDEDYDNI